MTETRRQHARFAAIFASGTMISRALGLARDVVLGAMIPAASRDSFFFAFMFPNMLRDMLGEGACNAAFVPVFSESKEKDSPETYRKLVSGAMSAMLIVFVALTVAGILLTPLLPALMDALQPLLGKGAKSAAERAEQLRLTLPLVQWSMPYLLFIGMAVFAMGPLFVARQYATASWAPALLNVALIVCCVAGSGYFSDPAWALVVGTWIGGIAQWVVMFASMRKHSGVWRPNFRLFQPGVGQICLLLGPVILGQATGEVNKVINGLFALSLEHNTVTALGFANRLVQLPLSVFGFAVAAVILPSMVTSAINGKKDEIRATLIHGFQQSFFLITPAMLGLLALGEPLARLCFQYGKYDEAATAQTAAAMFYYTLGLLSFAWIKVALQGFYAIKQTKTPVIVATACVLLNIALNAALVGPMGYRGLAFSTTVSYTVNFLLLFALLCAHYGRLWNRELILALLKISIAAVVMAAAAYALHGRLDLWVGHAHIPARLLAVGLSAGVGAVLYAVLGKVLGIQEVEEFLSVLRRKRI